VHPVIRSAVESANAPVRVPWRAPVRGFVLGFLAALLPAAIVASWLPYGRGAALVLLATTLAFAGAVLTTAKEHRS